MHPTAANVSYGPHERNVLDFWQAESTEKTPVLLSIHGGGFRGGDKGVIVPGLLEKCLAEGISVITFAYRFSQHAIAPASFQDCARALQFVRSKADEWNLDKTRIASTGGSAGAGISQWLAFKDDMAEPDSPDPIARESTRLRCVALYNGQTSYDPRFIRKIIPGPAYKHAALAQLFGTPLDDPDNVPPEKKRLFEEVSAMTHLTADDPPSIFFYDRPNDPELARDNAGAGIHHPLFAVEFKKKCDALGIECRIRTEIGKNDPALIEELMAFLRAHLVSAP